MDEVEDDDEEESSSLDPFASTISSFSPDNEMFYSQSASDHYNEPKSKESDDSDDEGEEIYRSEMVLMGSIQNRQEIRINMKLAEQINGPKVSLELTLGGLLLFFTPRQFHMLLLLCDILLNGEASSGSEDDKNLKEKFQVHSMDEGKKKYANYGGSLVSQQTWSGEDYDCSNDAKGMQYYNTLRPVGSDSILSSNSSMTSSMQSSASQATPHSHRHKRAIERDQNADISQYNIRIAGIYLILLHDDILISDIDSLEHPPLNELSVQNLRNKSEHFFNYSTNFLNTCNTSDLTKIGAIFNNACDNNHLR